MKVTNTTNHVIVFTAGDDPTSGKTILPGAGGTVDDGHPHVKAMLDSGALKEGWPEGMTDEAAVQGSMTVTGDPGMAPAGLPPAARDGKKPGQGTRQPE